MKNKIKLFGIIALIAIIGFAMIGCSDDPDDGGIKPPVIPDTTPGSGTYPGKDVLGNSYSLSVGSSVTANISMGRAVGRAAKQGDTFKMTVTPRDGKPRNVTGTVKSISADGTLTLKTGTGEEFTATVDSSDLKTVAGVGDEMPKIPFTGDKIGGSQALTPRTFDAVYLRATRWSNPSEGSSGEHWGSGKSVLLRDYPTNVSTLQANSPNRYTITISGTSDKALNYIAVEVQGLDANDNWQWLTGFSTSTTVAAGSSFNITEKLYSVSTTVNLLNYKEIILQVTNVMKYQDSNTNTNNGSLGDTPDGTIMAAISSFKIELKDTSRGAFAGNMNDFAYGYLEDGMSVAYQQAVWSLTSANITEAKKSGAKFEFVLTGLSSDNIESENVSLGFIWQDPDRNLWWQDQHHVAGASAIAPYTFGEGVEWIPYQKKIKIDLDKAVTRSDFNSSSKLNFIIGYWWKGNAAPQCIDELAISGANIISSPSPNTTGNLGKYDWGYAENGVTPNYKQAVWPLSGVVLTSAQETGAKLVIEFASGISSKNPHLVLIWQGEGNDWWPASSYDDMTIGHWDGSNYVFKTGVTYDSGTKKLTIVLDEALEDYDTFKDEFYVNFVLDCVYGVTTKIDELGIIKADIVTD